MPRVAGKFDFRVCYRASFWERERAIQALSWTWRPYDCRLEPFDAKAFDAWLGSRTLVIVGDSLSAQLYYSFVLLLGACTKDERPPPHGPESGSRWWWYRHGEVSAAPDTCGCCGWWLAGWLADANALPAARPAVA